MRAVLPSPAILASVILAACSSGSSSRHSTTTTTSTVPAVALLGSPPVDTSRPRTPVDVLGAGSGHVPQAPGSLINMADGWTVSYAWTCPAASNKPAFTVTPKDPTGAPLDAPAVGADNAGTGEQLMSRGGRATLEIVARDPSCQWRVIVYGTMRS